MRSIESTTEHGARKTRAFAFAVCVACTLWLVVQNAILFSLLPWARLIVPLGWVAGLLRLAVLWTMALTLIGLAIASGWWMSRRREGAKGFGGSHD